MSHDPERESSALEARARALFERSVENLDGKTRSRLNQARQAALEELRGAHKRPWRSAWVPVGSGLAVAVLAVWMTVGEQARQPNENGVPVDDLELFAEVPTLDLLRDVEFYAWMAEDNAQRTERL
jgi:hypothetical protein